MVAKSKNKSRRNKKKSPSFVQKTRPKVPDEVKKQLELRKVEEEVKQASDLVNQIRSQTRDNVTRQMIKIMCISLKELYGFGRKRCATLLNWMADLINEEIKANDGDVGDFWYRVDEELKKHGMNFYPSEDDINKS